MQLWKMSRRAVVFGGLMLSAGVLFGQTGTAVTGIAPSIVMAGSSDLLITVTGTGFASTDAVVVYAVTDESGMTTYPAVTLTTKFIDANTLRALVPAGFLAKAANVSLNLLKGGGTTLANLQVVSPLPPVVDAVIPAGGTRGMTVSLILPGTHLVGSTISLAGLGLGVQQITDGSLTVTIAADAPLGSSPITVSTPSGTTSLCGTRPCTFTVVEDATWTNVTVPAGFTVETPAVKLLDGRVLVVCEACSAARIFDPVAAQWSNSMVFAGPARVQVMLPDGRILFAPYSNSPAQIFDPVAETLSATGTMIHPYPVKAILLPNGKVMVLYQSVAEIGAELFDPSTGLFQTVSGFGMQGAVRPSSIEVLSDGRVLLAIEYNNGQIYDPASGAVSPTPAIVHGTDAVDTLLLPDGRALVRGNVSNGPFVGLPDSEIYDPRSNTVAPTAGNEFGNEVLLNDGRVFIAGVVSNPHSGPFGRASLYDPATDQTFLQSAATPPVNADVLLDDGRVFGAGTPIVQIYTPPAYTAPKPVIGSVLPNDAPASQTLALDIHGSSFLPTSAAFLGSNKLVTLYLGAQHLVAFVPSALRPALSSGIAVGNPGPGGGTTDAVRPGFTGTIPLPIPEVETGTIRTGYVLVTADPGTEVPVSTLTYGSVSGGIVQSQAGVLPTLLTSDASMLVDIVRPAGRDLGIAIANPNATSSSITLTLRDLDGNIVGSPVTSSVSARAQVSRFLTEFFSASTIGSALRGSVTIQSSVPVSMLGLRFSGQEFSTIPIPITNPASVPAQSGVGGPNAIIFPQFAMSGGWATTLGLVNNTSNPISGRVDVFDPNGNPLTVPWNGQGSSTFRYTIESRGTLILAPRDSNGQSPF
jgi:hypothetical protein